MVAKAQLSLSLEHAPDHFDALHSDPHGVVIVWEALRPKGEQWTKLQPNDPSIPQFLANLHGQQDTYITVNQFHGWRRVGLLKSLRAVYVDLDGNTDLEGAIDALRGEKMPSPSFAVYSGRGLHLYWLLRPTPAQALPVWQRITDALNASLTNIGADPAATDCPRVLRLVGTTNSKNGATVRGLVVTGYEWTLHELADEVLGHRKPRQKAQIRDLMAESGRQGKKAPRAISGSIYARWYKVYGDLLTIARHHGGMIPDGHRDAWLFLVGVSLSWFTKAEALVEEIEDAAARHTSLSPVEIANVSRLLQQKAEAAAAGETVEWEGMKIDPRYRFRRATLYTWMRGLIPDALLPELRAIVPDAVARERKLVNDREKAREKYGYEDRYTGTGVKSGNAEKREKACRMAAEGTSQRKIATELGVSQSAVKNWLRAGEY